MARPRSEDPLVQLPVRVPTSMLATLRVDAESVDQPLSDRVRELLSAGLVLLGKIDEAEPVAAVPLIVTPTPTPGARCTCAKPLLSRIAPVCTSCHLRR